MKRQRLDEFITEQLGESPVDPWTTLVPDESASPDAPHAPITPEAIPEGTEPKRTIQDGEEQPCPFCQKTIIFAIDDKPSKTYKLGRSVTLEAASRNSGQFILRGAKAIWWGPIGGDYQKHICPNMLPKGSRKS